MDLYPACIISIQAKMLASTYPTHPSLLISETPEQQANKIPVIFPSETNTE